MGRRSVTRSDRFGRRQPSRDGERGAGGGAATVAGYVPPSLAGGVFTIQAFVADGTTAVGFSNSNGFEVQVQ